MGLGLYCPRALLLVVFGIWLGLAALSAQLASLAWRHFSRRLVVVVVALTACEGLGLLLLLVVVVVVGVLEVTNPGLP
jgi:hypothetical protein